MNSEHKDRMTKLIKKMIGPAAFVAGLHVLSAATLDRMVRHVEIVCPSPKIRRLHGYRMAFVTDIHDMPPNRLRDLVEQINHRRVDLLLLGGDFPLKNAAAKQALEILSRTQTRDGILGVEGNHDRFSGLFSIMEANGVTPLINSGVTVRENLYVGGIRDPRNSVPDVQKAVSGAGKNDFVLLLSHKPDMVMEQNTAGVDLVLSGHTHGGQITFFGLWAPFLRRVTKYGRKFRSGRVSIPGGPELVISRDVGSHKHVFRMFAGPQVLYITLARGRRR